jgi:DNA repair protein RadA/Sms
VNFISQRKPKIKAPIASAPTMLKPLSSVKAVKRARYQTGPWDGVFGGHDRPGVVETSANLIGGSPGAGKSTLLLQLSNLFVPLRDLPVIYIAAEQGMEDLRELSDRLELENNDRILIMPALGREYFDPTPIIQQNRPGMFIVDSLQAFVGKNLDRQLELCKKIKAVSDRIKAPSFIVSQVTKDHELAGLMAFQHEVDGVFKMVKHANDKNVRILEAMKNRNGPETALAFRIAERGLVLRPGVEGTEEDGD